MRALCVPPVEEEVPRVEDGVMEIADRSAKRQKITKVIAVDDKPVVEPVEPKAAEKKTARRLLWLRLRNVKVISLILG